MTHTKTFVNTPKCPVCGETGQLEIALEDVRGVIRWQGGMKIQHALPNWTNEMREQLMTGYHPVCWDNEWGSTEFDDDDS